MKAIILLILLFVGISSMATNYYVSSSAGSDFNTGTSDSNPWKTLTKVNSTNFFPGDQILFQRGSTFYGSLTVKNSGTAANPITYGAYGTGNNPVITGFTAVTSWKNLGSNIWESTEAVSTLETCNMVVVNGLNTPMGRYPNADAANGGYLTFQSHSGTTSITSSSLSGMTNWTGAQVVVRPNRWTIKNSSIISQSGGTLTFDDLGATPIDSYGFFIQNDIRTLDKQNEWFYNPVTKKLRIYSTSQPINVKVTAVDTIVQISGSYITIDGINIQGVNTYGIYSWKSWVTPSHHLIVKNCNVAWSGGHGIYVKGNYITIQNNTVSHVNKSAINADKTGGVVTISGNVVSDTFEFPSFDSPPGAVSANYQVKSIHVSNNKVLNSGHNAFSLSADSTMIIDYNFADTFNSIIDDGGGLYLGGNNTFGITIFYNILINGIGNGYGTPDPSSEGSRGIYLDDNCGNMEVAYNTVANCSTHGIFVHNSFNCNIHHNTAYNNNVAQLFLKDDDISAVSVENNNIHDNVFVSKGSSQYALYAATYYDNILSFGTFNNNYYARPIDQNLVVKTQTSISSGSMVERTLAGWKTYSSQDANSLGSPKTVSSVNDIYFYYNETKEAKVISIEQPSIDMASTAYYTPITLQPFTSVILLRDATLGYYYYLSTSGSDSNTGTSTASPWKTLSKINASNFTSGSKIYMKSGDVWSGETLNFTNAVQGWDNAITVTSYGTGNKPTISGFETLTSWTSDGNGIYHTIVSNSACNMVTVNGINTPIARYPKTGYLTFETYNGSTSITDNELTLEPSWTGAQAVIRVNGFQYTIANVTNHYWHTLTLSGSSTPDATGGFKYFLQNHASALTAVGDWYLSGTTLYMYFGANNPSSYTVKAAKVAKLVTTDKNYVTLDGIRIEGAIEKGYESTGTHNTVKNCDFEFMGRYGITCVQTTPTIDGNTLTNGNGTAIFMNANSYVLKNNTITNNGIHAGMVEPTTNNYFGINIIAGSGGTCEYNTISNVGYIGISTWGSDNIIRYNKVDGFCSILPDGGGVYANYIGSAPYPTGIKVYNNIVKNGGGEGLYSDAVNQNTEWYNNTVSNCISGILLNTPINHNVHDNTFFNCTFGMNFYNWHTNSLTPTGCTVSNNTIVEGTNSTFAVKIGDSTNRDILSMGTVNGNKFYSETGKQTAQFKAYFNPAAPLTNYNIADWRTLTGFEATSTLTTLSSFASWSVYENATKVEVVTPLGTPMMDLDGNKFATGVPLGSFMSKILAIDPNPSSTNPTGKKKVLKTNGKYFINSKTGRFFVK